MLLQRATIISLLGFALALQGSAQDSSSTQVDYIVQLVKGGMSEARIIRALKSDNKPVNLTAADMVKLKKNGVSDNIIEVLMDPSSSPAAAALATAPEAPAPPAPPEARRPPTLRRQEPVARAVEDDVDRSRQQAPQPATMGSTCPMPAAVSRTASSQKRRLAVEAFDYSAVRTQVTSMFNNDVNIGQGIRAMLNVKMAQFKSVTLVEREKLKALMAEQDLGATNRVRQGSKARIGEIAGADALLLGDIVIFGRDDTAKRNGGSGVLRQLPGPFGALSGRVTDARKTDKAVVAINLRLVDSETGELLAAEEARGESTRTSTDWGAVAGTWRGVGAAGSDMTSSNYQETIIGEATADAVTKIAGFLNRNMPQIGAKSRSAEGRVENFSGCTLYLTVGGNDGVQVGDRFEIHQIIGEIIDPVTREVLDTQTLKIGEVVIGEVREKISIGQYGGEPLSLPYLKGNGYAARLVMK